MATFKEFIASIQADGNDGKAFERFCKWFLLNDPYFADFVAPTGNATNAAEGDGNEDAISVSAELRLKGLRQKGLRQKGL